MSAFSSTGHPGLPALPLSSLTCPNWPSALLTGAVLHAGGFPHVLAWSARVRCVWGGDSQGLTIVPCFCPYCQMGKWLRVGSPGV